MSHRVDNPCWQYLCIETYFHYDKSFDPRDFVRFREGLRTDIAEKLYNLSISLIEENGVKEKRDKETLLFRRRISPPADTKPHRKIIEGWWKISKKEDIELRQIRYVIYCVLDWLTRNWLVKYIT